MLYAEYTRERMTGTHYNVYHNWMMRHCWREKMKKKKTENVT